MSTKQWIRCVAILCCGWIVPGAAAATPPSIGILSPVSGAAFSARPTLTLVAGVTNGSGSVTNVEFYQNSTKVAETNAGSGSTFRGVWPNVAAGPYILRAVARANDGVSATSAPVELTISSLAANVTNLVPAESIWKYLETGANLGTTWRAAGFDDSAWASGPAQLGYGDGEEVTTVGFGPDANNKYVTTYFRRAFTVADVSVITNLTVRVIHDDGVAVYLNGTEIFRRNLDAGAAFNTLAQSAIGSPSDESITFYAGSANASLLVNGANVLAVEMHQSSLSSSDLSFDLELLAEVGGPNVLPSVSISTPANGAVFAAPASNYVNAAASDSDGIARVDLYTNGVFHRSEFNAPYEWSIAPLYAGPYSYRAVAIDNRGGAATSSVVSITVTGNVPPTASIASPANNAAFSAPADVVISATAADPDGTVSKVEFYRNGAKIGEDLSAPFSYTNTGVGIGSYQLAVVATDNLGARGATSAIVNITVSANTPPAVTLTNPVDNASFVAPASILLAANATDSEGAVASVAFYQNGSLLSVDSSSPFSFSWNSVPAGSYSLTAVATDAGGLTATSAVVSITVTNPPGATTNTLIAGHSVWKYLDNGSDQGTAWRAVGFNDASWASGPAELGYGDGDEATTVGFGPDGANKYITTYFRQSFVVGGAASYTNLGLTVVRDDGAVVYLNGTEIFRSPTMPPGTILFNTLAGGNGDDNIVDTTNITSVAGLLLEGANVVAVEIHQNTGNSSDISFNLQLLGVTGTPPPSNAPPSVTLTNPANGATFAGPANITLQASASDPDGSVVRVDFYNNGTLLGQDSSSPYNLAWNGVSAANYTLTAVAIDDGGMATTSAPVNITVTGTPNVPPTVNITAPANNTTNLAPSTVTINTSVNDTDGTVTKVEFFRSGVKIGEDTTNPFSLDWSNALVGSFQLTAIATDNNSRTGTSSPVSITFTSAAPSTLVSLGSVWKYLDNGSDQATAWQALGYDDSSWSSGPAQLGYGDGDEATVVGYGPDANNRYVTTYFRHAFTVGNPAAYSVIQCIFRRDDGIAVYINGVEVARNNLSPGAVFNTYASSAGDDGQAFFTNNLNPNLLVVGPNIVAAEIHQATPSSSDISFDLALIGNTGAIVNNSPTVALTAPAGGTVYTEPAGITMNAAAADTDGTISKVEFFANGAKVGEDTSGPFSFTLGGVTIGSYALNAIATDNLGATATSAVVNVSVVASTPPLLVSRTPAPGAVSSLTQVSVTFSEPVDGVSAGDLLINGSPASAVSAASPSNFVFTFAQPMDGPVVVRFAGNHGIVDRESPPKRFDETAPVASWQYTLADSVAPGVVSIEPVPSATLRSLSKVTVQFSEAVGGVNAIDLRMNGVGATSVSGYGAGPYVFNFNQPTNANPLAILMQWTNTHGIADFASAPNAFTSGTNWTYTLNTNYVQTNIVINEIMYHPSSELVSEEYIELLNRGGTQVRLTGWRFSGGVSFTFPNITLNAGAYLVVAANVQAFTNKYPGVTNVIGGWIGQLSNSDEDIDLDDALGQRVDSVRYSDDGDWAVRRVSAVFPPGWDWLAEHDGLGRSLELINPAMPNQHGQNWSSSATSQGTPGRTNSVVTNNVAPLILNVAHAPAVPKSTDSVTITARLLDESTTGLSATLHWRTDAGAFTGTTMFDNGLNGDGIAGDGTFGAVLPPMANLTIVEFYVHATDSGSRTRTWPGPTDGSGTQGANAHYQVDDETYSGRQPLYRMILTAADEAAFAANSRGSDAQFNMTFITTDAAGTEVRYNSSIRYRGNSSRFANPPTMRASIPRDRRWKGLAALNLNSQFSYSQLIGSVVSRKAGLDSEEALGVQLRRNGVNPANSGSSQYGSYVHVESRDSDWAENHFPFDPNGNLYTCTRPSSDLAYRGTNPQDYFNAGYEKDTNASENDYSDIFLLTSTLQVTNDANYAAAVRQIVNVEQWLRYFAVMSLIGFGETSIGSDGQPDDYSMYSGAIDRRFHIFPHDHDTDFGQGDGSAQQPNNSIFRATAGNAQVNRFLKHPDFAPLYFAEVQRQLETTFAFPNIENLFDNHLGDWIPAANVTAMKNWMAQRRASVLSQIPLALTVTPPSLPVVNGFYRTTSASLSLDGRANAIRTRSVLVGGQLASWTAWQGTWSGTAQLRPGINRIVIQSLDGDGEEIERSALDVWYDDGTVAGVSGVLAANTTWTAAGGPYQVTGNLTVGAGVTLTIEPGTTVYVNSGVTITVSGTGRLIAEGSEGAHIRFTRLPGSAGNWGSLDFIGAGTESRLAFVDIDSCGGTTISGQNAQIHVNNSRVFFDHLTFANTPAVQYIAFDASSFIVQNSLFPSYPAAATAPHLLRGINGIPGGGHAILRGNYFGRSRGSNDTVEFSGGQRPGPILQVIANIFDGAGDEQLSLNGADAWIEGNLFMHVHRDTSRTDSALDTASAISGGTDVAGQYPEWTILNNLFYDVDHAVLSKQGGRFAFVNNTLVHVNKENGSGQTGDIAAFILNDNALPLPAAAVGAGAYIAGNIIWDAPMLVANYNAANHTVIFENNLLPLAWSGPGANNTVADPLLNLSLITNPLTADWRTVLAALQPRAGSPAIGTGMGGHDKGALNPRGILVFGEPYGKTSDANAALSLAPGGTFNWGTNRYDWGYTHYRWQLDGGAWSAETAVTNSPRILLSGLAPGLHSVSVAGRNDAGWYQDDVFVYPLDSSIPAHGTESQSWIVNPMVPTVRINEVLARNDSAVPVGSRFPDLIELFNPGSNTVSLAGMGITDEPDKPFKFVFPGGTTIGPGQYMLLYADNEATPPGLHLGFSIKQSGDEVFLTTAGGMLFDSVSFGPQLADRSVGRLADGSWTLCVPTFTGANVAAQLGDMRTLKINEWLASGFTPYPDDFIELFNPDPLPVALGDLYLTDTPIGAPARHDIAPLSFIAGGGYAVFIADGDPSIGPDHVNFSLRSEQGMVALMNADLTMIDCVIYGPQATDISMGRQPNGGATYGLFSPPTPGGPNPTVIAPNTTVVINEILSLNINKEEADGSTPDWVEFYNPTTNAIDMADMSLTDNTAVPRKFVFPAGTVVPPLGYRAIKCDPDIPTGTNNAGFGLKSTGQALYLYDKLANGGSQLNAVSFGVQAADFSIGRVPSGGSNWVLCLESIGANNVPVAALGLAANLRVNEWMADPDGGDDWFEIYNPNPQPVALGGLHLSDNLSSPASRMKHPIAPLSFIGIGAYGFQRFEADGVLASGPEHVNFSLSKDGDEVGISTATGALIDGIAFGGQTLGVSEGRLPDGAAFVTAFPGTDSPGDPNYVLLTTVVINEALTHSDPPFEDAIEVRNLTAAPVDISGWWISDEKHDLQKLQVPPNTILPPNGFKVFYEFQFNDLNNPPAFSLNSAKGDEIYLAQTASGALTGYRSQANFGAGENAVSFGRYVTSVGEAHFVAMALRTFGADNAETLAEFRTGGGLANSSPKVGPIVISEIMYHPPDIGGTNDDTLNEFIELRNITGATVPLYHPQFTTNTWRLRDAVSFTFPQGISIPAQEVVLVVPFDPVANPAQLSAFRAKYNVSPAAAIYGPWSGQLRNSDDSVELVKPDAPQQPPDPDAGFVPYILVDKVKYFDLPPWPSADGNGDSLQRLAPDEYGNDPINWTAAVPSPGPQGYLLSIAIVSISPTVLEFTAEPGKAYTVVYKNTLNTPSWSNLANVPAGAGGAVQVTDPSPHPAYRFYRVREQ